MYVQSMSFVPSDITIPEARSQTARKVLSAAIRRVLSDLSRLPVSRANPAVRRAHQQFARVVGQLLRSQPGAVASVLRRPNIGGLVRTLRSCPRPGVDENQLFVELHATTVVELAIAGALVEPYVLELVPAKILSLGAQQVFVSPPGVRQARVDKSGVTYVCEGATTIPFTRQVDVYAPIAGSQIVLALADNNPLSDFEAHPDKQGNQIDLGDRPATAWTESLAGALGTIGRLLPELRGEIELFIHQIVPVGFDAQRHLSASYQEAIGTIYLTLHPQPMTMVEAVIHEFSHNKINALFEVDRVLENAFSPLFRSPIRPDPRPLHGILLAVHAFLPVARLYEKLLAEHDHPDLRRRFGDIVRKNHDGAQVLLEHAVPTAVGCGVLDEISRWDTYFASWRN